MLQLICCSKEFILFYTESNKSLKTNTYGMFLVHLQHYFQDNPLWHHILHVAVYNFQHNTGILQHHNQLNNKGVGKSFNIRNSMVKMSAYGKGFTVTLTFPLFHVTTHNRLCLSKLNFNRGNRRMFNSSLLEA